MKLHEIKEDDAIGFDALYASAMKCKKGVSWKDSVAAYYHRAVERTDKLEEDLHRGKYRAAPPKHFMVTCPKPREIASIAFRDRVYQRSLNDNVVYPIMTNAFIYDNFACQTGKGTDPARERLKHFLRKHFREHGTEGYVAQFDIHGYYPNMRHDIAEENFRKKLPEWAYERVVRIMHEQYSGDVGYNPGSQLIQIEGISLLNDLDHLIKEKLHVKLYIRYMDDLIMIHEDKEFLEHCKTVVVDKLAKIGFEVNEKKTKVYRLSEGIPFLGFRFSLTETGKVLMFVNPDKVKSARKKYRRLVAKAKRGEVPRESVDMSWATWIDHLSKGDTYNLINRLNKFYKKLWEDDKDGTEKKDAVPGRTGETGERGSTG